MWNYYNRYNSLSHFWKIIFNLNIVNCSIHNFFYVIIYAEFHFVCTLFKTNTVAMHLTKCAQNFTDKFFKNSVNDISRMEIF